MRSWICIAAILLCGITNIRACDICGCSSGNQYLGILPKYNWNFVGLQYQYSKFESKHPSAYSGRPDVQGEDAYHTVQLWGRYNVSSRYQVFVFVPYHYNIHREDTLTSRTSGMGDVSIMVNRIVINHQQKKWKHLLLAGAGVKLPTGKHNGTSSQDRAGLPNMQPGTGATDFIANANYTLSQNKLGVNADAAYTFTTANGDNYKYGNRLSTGGLVFYPLTLYELILIPSAGARYEYTLHDYDNYRRKWLNEQSGGYMCFATAGLQVYYKRTGARITTNLPVSQHYATGYVTAKQKLEVGIFLLF